MDDLKKQIAALLNKICRENKSNTPDFILAEFLLNCLDAFETTTKKRDKWYGVHLAPCDKYFYDVDERVANNSNCESLVPPAKINNKEI